MQAMPDPLSVLDSVNDGVYVTDTERRIRYWNPSAQRITGWTAGDIIGKSCYDDVLCHEDKDGRRLCGEEHCPLHRAIVTGNSSSVPIIVFAKRKDGSRVPVRVSVAPVHDAGGRVIGGVETFRDLSLEIRDFQRAQKIQARAMRLDVPPDPRITFKSHTVAVDIVGGDFVTACQLDEDRYGFLLADVSGHGIAAGLYTLCLYPLWKEHRELLHRPRKFAETISRGLCDLMDEEGAFAAATCGMIDLASNTLQVTGAGNPEPLLFRADGSVQKIDCTGLPLGIMTGAAYSEVTVPFNSGDSLLLATDGATEVTLQQGGRLGVDGLVDVLARAGYPRTDVELSAVEKALLLFSDRVRFDDDLTLLELRRQ